MLFFQYRQKIADYELFRKAFKASCDGFAYRQMIKPSEVPKNGKEEKRAANGTGMNINNSWINVVFLFLFIFLSENLNIN